ncbi:unnamed protein product [Lasius platythorax]|uniref:Uncharacterized protein n=1 Tax=Lasius platythorax TaxID=488582 RepID=A0AAV2NUI5_9HYME
MLKIITISCIIVAVSLNFQKVKGLNLLPPIPHIIPDIIPHIIPDIIPKEPSTISPIENNNIPNLLNDASKQFEDILKGFLKRVQNANASCTKLYNEGRETVIQLSSALNSCLKERNETLSANANIKKLTDLASNVQRSLTEDVHNTLQCLQNPLNVASCLNVTNPTKNLAGLNINELISAAISEVLTIYPFNLIGLLPDTIECYKKLTHEFNLEHFCGLVADTGNCIQSIIQILA